MRGRDSEGLGEEEARLVESAGVPHEGSEGAQDGTVARISLESAAEEWLGPGGRSGSKRDDAAIRSDERSQPVVTSPLTMIIRRSAGNRSRSNALVAGGSLRAPCAPSVRDHASVRIGASVSMAKAM